MDRERSPKRPTKRLANRRNNGQLDRTNGGVIKSSHLDSAGEDPRLHPTKPSVRRQQSRTSIFILDDDYPTSHHGDEDQSMAWLERGVSFESIAQKTRSEQQSDFETRGKTTVVSVIEDEFQRNHALPSKPRPTRVLNILSSMKEKRMNIVARRLQLQEEREMLRTTRDANVDLAANFMTSLNIFFATHDFPEIGIIKDEYEKFREALDGYLPKEHDYNQLEDDLNQEEYELKELESKAYRKLERLDRRSVKEEESRIDDNDSQSSESASTISYHQVYPPLLHELLSRLGDVDMVKEQLANLRLERAYLVEQQRLLASAGRELGGSSRELLVNFDLKHEELRRRIVDLEADADRLKGAWDEENLACHSEREDTCEEIISLEDTTLPEPDPLLVDQVSSIKNLPDAQIQQVLVEEPLSPSVLPRYEELRKKASVGVLRYINEWFLWRLRRSRLEVKRYKSEPSLNELRGQEPYLSDLILDYWFSDTATGLLSATTDQMIPKSNTIVSGDEIGRDGLSRQGSTVKSDSHISAMRQLTRLFRASPQRFQERVGLRNITTRRSSAPDTSANITC
ncbi:MAG: hypothetical protein Q9160_003731 [Pyrenula sp. 1 TL-2023]